jgi:hypothetical protein
MKVKMSAFIHSFPLIIYVKHYDGELTLSNKDCNLRITSVI